jgi:hypothetical protein
MMPKQMAKVNKSAKISCFELFLPDKENTRVFELQSLTKEWLQNKA